MSYYMNMKITKTCFKTGKIIYYSTGVILPISSLPKKKICNLKLHFYQAHMQNCSCIWLPTYFFANSISRYNLLLPASKLNEY